MNKTQVTSYAWYMLIPLAWLTILAAFLYSPYISKWLTGKRNSLTIFLWADVIDPDIIRQFEEKTGIKVYVNYYEGNDELLAKLQFSEGKGYDIIMPTHYVVPSLVERGFLKKIDKTKLTFWPDISSHLTGLTHDPTNTYTIPFAWEIYGLGINQKIFKQPLPNSWQALFQPQGYKVGMTDEPREIIHLAAQYLFGSVSSLDKQQQKTIKSLLIKQKKSVEAYTDMNVGTILESQACPIVLAPSSSIHRINKTLSTISFVLPKEGSVIALENLAIATHSQNEERAYQFINFVFEPERLQQIYQRYGYLPARASVLQSINLWYLQTPTESLEKYFKKVSLIHPLMSRQELYSLWLAIKAY